MTTITIDQLVQQASQLPITERIRLIQLVAKTLVHTPVAPMSEKLWRFGAFKGDNISTEADFTLAEWHPT